MAYTPTTWVDNVTPVNAANLNKVETGLDAADQAATDAAAAAATKISLTEKAAVNGVATLGADGLVPLAQLPEIGGGAELVFEGDWAAPTTYQDGDYVVKDGVVFVCVGGPTTTPPDVSIWGGAGTAPSSAVSYGTSFPTSPVSGQEHILVDSTTNPTYQWRFRYNAGSTSAYKWEFVGGPPLLAGPLGSMTIQTTTPTDLTSGPTLVVPRSGEYEIEWAVLANNAGTIAGPHTNFARIMEGTTAGTEIQMSVITHQWGGSRGTAKQHRTMTAGNLLKMQCRSDSAGANSGFSVATIEIIPVRVA